MNRCSAQQDCGEVVCAAMARHAGHKFAVLYYPEQHTQAVNVVARWLALGLLPLDKARCMADEIDKQVMRLDYSKEE